LNLQIKDCNEQIIEIWQYMQNQYDVNIQKIVHEVQDNLSQNNHKVNYSELYKNYLHNKNENFKMINEK